MNQESTSIERHPMISAVFVNWNRRELLQKAIQSIYHQNYKNIEIIVVDNGSTDDSIQWLGQQKEIQLIENEKNRGASAARNQGTRIAKGDYILYMDSDAELRTPGALQRLTNYMETHPDTAGVSGIYYSDEELRELWCWSPCMDWEGNHDLPASLTPKTDPPVLSTCFVLFRTAALEKTGGFDEFYFYLYEDADLCERLRKEGYRLHVDPSVKVYHRYADPGRTKRDEIGYHYYHERLRMYFVLKNWGLRRFIRSWWEKVRAPLFFFKQFPYLPLYCYIDIYYIRTVRMLLCYPLIRRRRKKKTI